MSNVSLLRRLFGLLSVLALLPLPAIASPNPVVVGHARFTVITPHCVRMEYAPSGKFVDNPSLFAADRRARLNAFRLRSAGGVTVIDTGVIRLSYGPDGRPFSPANLQAAIHNGSVIARWTPGAANPGNLGGTLRTLDGADGPEDLGQGLLSRDGWFLLDDSRTPLLTRDWVESRPQTAGTDWYLFGYGDDYKAALKSLAAIGGPVPLPRRYALGAWYSRYWPYTSADYRQIVQEYQQHDFPLDNMVMDMDWHREGWTGWSWNRKLLPDAEQLLQWDHRQGLHVTLNLHPADGVGPQEDQYAAFMRDRGADPATERTLPFDAGSKKYMDTLFQDVFAPLEKDGVDFWWLDWQQYPYTRSVPDLTNLFWLNTLLYDRTGRGGMRGLSFSRWAGWGDHRHPIHFSGDASTSWRMLAFEVPFTSTAGNVGCFFWSHDIGGHNRGRNEESYTRWVQFGATSPVLRSHSTRDPNMDRRPWLYPRWATDSMRVSFHLRDVLFPYIYSSAWETTQNTVPLDRPLYIDYPRWEQPYHNAQEYLFGDDLLAAPIVTPGVGPGRVSHQTVWFPPGEWYNYFTGERYASNGNTEQLVSANINEFPLYVRGGVPIPMQPYTPRMATTPLTRLVVRCYPGPEGQTGRFTLYEDDGQTTAYQRGQLATTPLSYVRHGNTVTVMVGAARGRYAGQPSQRSIIVELPDTGRASRATADGKPVTVTDDAANFVNRITLPAGPITRPATVVVQVAPAVAAVLHQRAVARRMAGVLGRPVTGQGVKAMLTAALSQTEDSAEQNELLAAAGVGLVHHNEEPYLYGNASRDYFYAPTGLLDGPPTLLSGGVALVQSGQEGLNIGDPRQRASVSFRFRGQEFRQPSGSLLSDDNVALKAKATASGSEGGYAPQGAVDGIVGGYPGDKSNEWSAGQNEGAWLRLDWDAPQTVDRIVLYDRPNLDDQVTSGTLTFSDGTTLSVGALPDDAARGLTLAFPPKTITWLKFTVTGVKPGTQNASLSEIAVFRTKTTR
ncbi:MAG: DUF5110 domain-containing protein [Armatimonadetes bacterium]|nr:DUF5110 domain-containing protein [Armatimonadota bacterium]